MKGLRVVGIFGEPQDFWSIETRGRHCGFAVPLFVIPNLTSSTPMVASRRW